MVCFQPSSDSVAVIFSTILTLVWLINKSRELLQYLTIFANFSIFQLCQICKDHENSSQVRAHISLPHGVVLLHGFVSSPANSKRVCKADTITPCTKTQRDVPKKTQLAS